MNIFNEKEKAICKAIDLRNKQKAMLHQLDTEWLERIIKKVTWCGTMHFSNKSLIGKIV